MATETFANLPSTTVSSGGTDAPAGGTGQSWTVASSASFPSAVTATGTQFHVADPALPSELIAVTNVSGTTWTVTRGAESTTPVAHAAGFTVNQVVSAGGLTTFMQKLTPTSVKTSAYNAEPGDFVPVDTTSGGVTVTLPTAPADKTVIGIKMVIQGGTNTVTIACGGSDVFNKASGPTTGTLTLVSQGLFIQYAASPAIWYVQSDDLPLSQLDARYTASVMTTLGDIVYENATPAAARLAGNTTALAKVLTQTGTGSISAVPSWAVQNYGNIFGNGADGTATLDGIATVTWASLAGSTYTMTRDAFLTGLTVNNAVTLKFHGWRVFCQGTVTSNGAINDDGNAGLANGTAGGAPGSGSMAGGRPGGAGTTTNGAAGSNGALGMASAGNGGTGSGGTAGTAGTGQGTAQAQAILRIPYGALSGGIQNSQQANVVAFGGSPGGGGGGGDTSVSGGGGGSGGGCVVCFAWAFVNNGTISAVGGAGGSPASGNTGGGGGGSGGLVIVYTLSAWTAGSITLTAGTGGTKQGTGTNGSNGAAGYSANVVLV